MTNSTDNPEGVTNRTPPTINPVLAPLCSLIRDHPRECLLLCGTGLTMACTKPWGCPDSPDPRSWIGLIENGIWHCEKTGKSISGDDLKAKLERQAATVSTPEKPTTDDLLEVAGSVWDALGDDETRGEWLQASVGKFEISEDGEKILRNIAILQRAGVTIATTNYDDLLCQVSGATPALISSTDAHATLTNPNSQSVVHFHGHFATPTSFVFTTAQYTSHVADQVTMLAENISFLTKNWITIGCGKTLDDVNFKDVLNSAAKFLPHSDEARQNYFIAQSGEMAKGIDVTLRAKVPFTEVGYTNHDELPGYVERLAQSVDVSPFERFGEKAKGITEYLANSDDTSDRKPSWTELQQATFPKVKLKQRDAEPRDFCGARSDLKTNRYLIIKASAGSGKSVFGLQLAIAALNEKRPVYWLTLRDGQDDFLQKLDLISHDDALIIIDEAHIDLASTYNAIAKIREASSAAELVALVTSDFGYESDDANTIRNSEGLTPHSLHIDANFYKQVFNQIAAKLELNLTERPVWNQYEKWEKQFKTRTLMFTICLLHHLQMRPNENNWNLDDNQAVDWLKRRFDLGTGTENNIQSNLAFLGLVGRKNTYDIGWVPTDALPCPSAVFASPRDALIMSRYRASFGSRQLVRLVQANTMGDLLTKAVSDVAKDRAENHLKSDAFLTARLLAQPDRVKAILNLQGNDVPQSEGRKQLIALMESHKNQFANRLKTLTPRSLATWLERVGSRDDNSAAHATLKIIPNETWDSEQLKARLTLDGAGSLTQWLFKLGQKKDTTESIYGNMIKALNDAVIARANPQADFLNAPHNLYNLAQLFRNLPSDEAAVQHFLEIVVTPAWLDRNDRLSAQPLHLSELAFLAEMYASNEVFDWLRQPCFHWIYQRSLLRVLNQEEISSPDRKKCLTEEKIFFDAMQVAGPAALLNISISDDAKKIVIRRFSEKIPKWIAGTVWCGDARGETIGHYQRKAWVGLRSMCEQADLSLIVSNDVVNQRLDLWRALRTKYPDAESKRVRSGNVSDSMIAWLERCQSNSSDSQCTLLQKIGDNLCDLTFLCANRTH